MRRRRVNRRLLLEGLENRRVLTVFSISDVVVDEDAGTAQLTVSADTVSGTASVDWATANGTATSSGDYTTNSGTVNLDTYTTSATVTITISDDSLKESGETLYVNLSNPSTGTIGDGTGLITIGDEDADGSLRAFDRFTGGGDPLHSGGFTYDHQLPSGLLLRYSTLTYGETILDLRTVQPDDSSVPSTIKAEFEVDSTLDRTIYYDTTGLSAGDDQRFAFHYDGTSSGSGTYEYQVDLTETVGSDYSYRTYVGVLDIYDRTDSAVGEGWEIQGLDRLAISTDWVTVLFSNGSATHYNRDDIQESGGGGGPGGGPGGGGGSTEEGLIEHSDGTFTYTTRMKGEIKFDSDGLITSRADANENTTKYTYNASDLLTKIEFQDGTDIDFAYDANDELDTITDEAGRVTTLTIDANGRLTKITSPDPDGAGGQAAPETEFTYSSTSGLMIEIENALGNSSDIDYDAYGRLEDITEPGTAVYAFEPQIVQGLVASGSGTQGSPADLPDADPAGSMTDPQSNTIEAKYDALGNRLEFTDALDNVTTWERNDAGRATKLTLPDPDGAGPLAAPVTSYEYDTYNNLTKITQPDSSTLTWVYDTDWNKPTKFTDAEGNETRYTLNSDGNVTEIIQVIGEKDDFMNGETDDLESTFTYSSNPTATAQMFGGVVLTATDPRGKVTTYTYGSNTSQTSFAKLITVTYADGTSDEAEVDYAYDSDGLLESITNELGDETEFAYDNLGRLTSTTFPDPDGAGSQTSPVVSRAYNALGQITSVTDPLSNVTSYTYDTRGRLLTVTLPDPDGVGGQSAPVTTYSYDSANRRTGIEDALGNDTTYAYDDAGRVTSITYPDPDGAGSLLSPVQEYEYDDIGRLITATDPLDRDTTYDYDVMSQIETITLPDPDGVGSQTAPEWDYAYDDNGRLTSITDPLSNVTSYEYDDAGRRVKQTLPDPDGAGSQTAPVTEYEYDKAGNLTKLINAGDAETTFTYDSRNRRTQATLPDPDGVGSQTSPVLSWAFDDASQLTSHTDALGSVTSYAYDDLGRLLTITHPDPDGAGSQTAPEESFTYDAMGRILTHTDPLDSDTTNTYNNLGFLTDVEAPDPDGAGPLSEPTTTYEYDVLGRLTSLTDPTNNETTWTLDNLGRITTETDPSSEDKTFVYDAASRLTSKTDREGRETEYNYDDLDRLTSEVWKDGATTVRTLSFTYDGANNLATASDPAVDYTFSYDNLYRQDEIEVDFGGSVDEFRMLSVFDELSRRTSLELEVDSGSGWSDDLLNSYAYDDLDRVTSIEQEGQSGGATVQDKLVEFTYTVDSQFDTISRYDDLAGGASNLVAESTYDYDDLGRLTSLEHVHDTTTIADYSFTFDEYSRITQIAATSSTGLAGTSDFTYDETGQLTDADHTHISDEDYSYDESGNRTNTGYTTGTGNRLTSDGTFNYTYDDEGNRITKSRISSAQADDKTVDYEWDHRNRLTKITFKNNSGTVTKEIEYEYDVFDRRVLKSVDADGAGAGTAVETRFVYDGDNILVVADDGGDIEQRILHGPAVDQVLAIEDDASSDVLWALTDHLGSVRDIVDNDGNVDNHVVYDAFGQVVSETDDTVDFIYGFTGRERDEESGLNYHRARYYDTATGRWLSEDPIGFAAGDANIQRYVGNDPVNYRDPSGLIIESGAPDVPGFAMWAQQETSGAAKKIENKTNEKEPVWPEINNGGPYGGTPKAPVGDGLAIAIWGEHDNPKYKDYATEIEERAMWLWPDEIRPMTTDLKDGTVSDIILRSAPISATTWREILRISRPGTVVTITNTKEAIDELWPRVANAGLVKGFKSVTFPKDVLVPSRSRGGKLGPQGPARYFSIILGDDPKYVGGEDE